MSDKLTTNLTNYNPKGGLGELLKKAKAHNRFDAQLQPLLPVQFKDPGLGMNSFSDKSKNMPIGSECFLTILKTSNRPEKDSVVAENHHLEACTPPRTGIIPRTRPGNVPKVITFWHVFRTSTRFGEFFYSVWGIFQLIFALS